MNKKGFLFSFLFILFSFLFIGKVSADFHNLPSAYQEVEYIESSGTQYIDTGVLPFVKDSNTSIVTTFKTEIVFQKPSVTQGATGNEYIAGVYTGSYIKYYPAIYNNDSGEFGTYVKQAPARQSPYVVYGSYDTNIHKVVFNDPDRKIYYDDVEVENQLVFDFNKNAFASLKLFALDSSGTIQEFFTGRMYSVKMWNNNTDELVRNMIPCYRKSDNEVGMYDLVNNVFYSNLGSGSFTKGSNVVPSYNQSQNDTILYNNYHGLNVTEELIDFLFSTSQENKNDYPYLVINKEVDGTFWFEFMKNIDNYSVRTDTPFVQWNDYPSNFLVFVYNNSTHFVSSINHGTGNYPDNGKTWVRAYQEYNSWFNVPKSIKNFNLALNSTDTWYKDFSYADVDMDLDFTIHLNGGTAFDTSDILNPVLHTTDFTFTGTSEEFHEYITHLSFIKSNYDYDSLFYDSNFTQSYSSSDTFSSNTDIYVKFNSKIYNINNIDYFEFKFDDLPLTETDIDFDYHFKSVTFDGQNETIQFSAPFGREYYTGCDDNNQNCSPSLKSKDLLFYDLDYINYDYNDSKSFTFNSNPEHITDSFSVILPTESLNDMYIYIDFDSTYDYEMIIHYKDDIDSYNSYIETIDLTGKYGVVFLPVYDNDNFVDDDSYYLTKFKVVGSVDIQVTDSRDNSGYNILQLYSMGYCNNRFLEQVSEVGPNPELYDNTSIPYNCDNSSGIFNFKINNKTANQTLRFVNASYNDLSDITTLVYYDSRYFNYGLLYTPFSTAIIEDPVTHEQVSIGLSEFYNQLDKQSLEGSKKNFVSSFNRFVYPIKFIFMTISKLYNNYLNVSMQYYFFIIFSLAIIILVIRVIF